MKELKVLDPPASFHYTVYIADFQGCGYIRVLLPIALVNQSQFKGYSIRGSYNSTFINDIRFYKNLTWVQFQRAYTEAHLKTIKHYTVNVSKVTKTPILYEIDDLLFDIPKWNYAAGHYNKNADTVKKILDLVRGVTCSTEKLKEAYSEYNDNIVVIPNHLVKSIWGDIKVKHENEPNEKKPRILYFGSSNHFSTSQLVKGGIRGGDFSPELIEFIKKTVTKYQWIIAGGFPEELKLLISHGVIEYHPWQPILYIPNYLKQIDADIGIAPLEQNNFNECKSNIKALEYSALGIPAVYTNIEPYKDMKCTCDTTSYMIDRIESLAASVDIRKQVYNDQYEVVKDQLFWEENGNIKKYINAYLSLFGKKMRD